VIRDLSGRFKKTVQELPDDIAIRYKGKDGWTEITYAELGKHVGSLAAFLLEEGVTKGDRIAILADNRPEWPFTFFAAVSIGAVCVPLNPGTVPAETESFIKDSECRIIFTDKSSASLTSEIRSKCPSVEKVVSVDSDIFKKALLKPSATEETFEISGDDTACILYTSGTTAVPKGVVLSHWNLVSNCDSQYKSDTVTRKDSVISILPLHHTYPLTATMILPILYGAKIIYPKSMRPEDISEAMRESGGTIFIAVPQMFVAFHQRITEALRKIPFPFNLLFNLVITVLNKIRQKTGLNPVKYFLYAVHSKFGKSMRIFVSGGAKLDENVAKDLYKFGFTILEGYGLTETSPVLTFNPAKKAKIGSVGLPVPGVEIKIKDKDKEGIGEVIARGPNIMQGYYKREDLTKEAIKDGWFHTGDLGYIDEEGYLFLTGRLKDVIVLSSGVNVYPEEVEEAYMKDAPVSEMCVFEIPVTEGKGVLELWAIVVPDLEFFRKYGEVNLKAVIKERFDNVSRSLPTHMRLMGFTITLEELPRTLLGKIKRFAVKEKYISKVTEEKSAAEPREIPEEDLEMMEMPSGRRIIDYLKKQTGIKRDIVPADLLELDLGIDSLGRVELLSGLERIFGIEIEDEIVGDAFTVRDLIAGLGLLLPEGTSYRAHGKEMAFEMAQWKETLGELPKKENLDKIDLSPGFWTWLGCFIFVAIHYLFFRLFYSLKVEGKENVPEKGPYILYSNHTSYFDGFLVAVSVPRFPKLDLFFVGFRPYFTVPIIRNLIRIGRIIPLDFSSHLLEALKSCYYVLKNGRNLCLFPEGIRTLDGDIGKFKKGFGILAKETDAKLVPVVLKGAYEAWPRTDKFPHRHPIKVRFGEAITPEEAQRIGRSLDAQDDYEAVCLGARDVLIKLKEKK
jgi:long-chain acyl-CoA synthetase